MKDLSVYYIGDRVILTVFITDLSSSSLARVFFIKYSDHAFGTMQIYKSPNKPVNVVKLFTRLYGEVRDVK